MSTFKTVLQALVMLSRSDFRMPVMIRGPHGIGKTALFQQLAEDLGVSYFAVYGAQLTEGDILGVPRTEEFTKHNGDPVVVTDFCLPKWLTEACDQPSVLVFEEVDRADPQVRKAFMQLACERRLWNMELHPETIIGAAINGGKYGQNYDVLDMDPAEQDRWAIFDFDPTVDEWIAWAKQAGNIPNFVINFVRDNPRYLEHRQAFDPIVIYPSRRSWARFGEVLHANEVAALLSEDKKQACNLTSSAGLSMVGEEATLALVDYMYQIRNVTYRDVLEEGEKLHEEMDDPARMIDILENLFEDQEAWDKLTLKQYENLVNWIFLGPGDFAVSGKQKLFAFISAKQIGKRFKNGKGLLMTLNTMELRDGSTTRERMKEIRNAQIDIENLVNHVQK